MGVFRVNKNKNYTVMSNVHLRDKDLPLKAKGLLSLMLSLPEDWDYSMRGLAKLSADGLDSTRAAVKALERSGYVVRRQLYDSRGRFSNNEYTVAAQFSVIGLTVDGKAVNGEIAIGCPVIGKAVPNKY